MNAYRSLTRRRFIQQSSSALALAALSGRSMGQSSAPQTRRPNIVVLYLDDLDACELGFYNPTGAMTPTIDRLMRTGTRFSHFYITSPVCTPSRYSLMTAQLAGRCRHMYESQERQGEQGEPANMRWQTVMTEGDRTLAHSLSAVGYRTGVVGKWMIGTRPETWLNRPKLDPKTDPRDPHAAEELQRYQKETCCDVRELFGFEFAENLYPNNPQQDGLPRAVRHHHVEWVTDAALRFLDGSANDDRPFFLYLPSTVPHGPEPVRSMRQDPLLTIAGPLDQPLDVQPSRQSVFDRVKKAGLPEEAAGMLWLDDQIKVVLDRIEAMGQLENTIVLLASDHGNRGKLTCYEGGANVPCCIIGPGIPADQQIDALTANIDITPTLCQLAGADLPGNPRCDGLSWLPLLTGQTPQLRDHLYLEIAYDRAIVTQQHKYIARRFPASVEKAIADNPDKRYGNDGTTPVQYDNDIHYFPDYHDRDQLYDLTQDPLEQNNRYDDPALQPVRERLRDHLTQALRDLPYPFGEFTQN
jgi:arylsulfatase A-like enzyme